MKTEHCVTCGKDVKRGWFKRLNEGNEVFCDFYCEKAYRVYRYELRKNKQDTELKEVTKRYMILKKRIELEPKENKKKK